jgi:hypothetical protein
MFWIIALANAKIKLSVAPQVGSRADGMPVQSPCTSPTSEG